MGEDGLELEMRIEGLDTPDGFAKADRALRSLDPAATLRFDDTTGIAHLRTRSQALEVEDALTRAGLTVTAATG